MTAKKADPKALLLWRLRLFLGALPFFILTSLFCELRSPLWLALTGVWVLLFLGFYLAYYPIKYHRLSYRLTGERLLVTSGVVYWRTTAIELANIQFVSLVRTPLATALGLASVTVHAAGGRAHLSGLRYKEAARLTEVLQ